MKIVSITLQIEAHKSHMSRIGECVWVGVGVCVCVQRGT